MTSIANLLDPSKIKAMKEATMSTIQTPVQTCTCGGAVNRKEGFRVLPGTTLAVCAVCDRPTATAAKVLGHVYAKHLTPDAIAKATPAQVMEVKAEPMVEMHTPDLPPVTTINGVEVDLRSEALHDTECADCGVPLQVEVAPEGVDLELLTSKERVAVCTPCGRERVRGKKGTLVLAKIDPNEPARTVKPEKKAKKAKKETPMIDLTNYSDAQLSTLALEARDRLLAEREAEVPAKRKKAKKAEREQIALDEQRKARAREERKGRVLPGFTIKGKEVPALDLSEITDTAEMPSAKERSPYNKALYALGMPLLDKDATTYEVLAGVHGDLLAMVENKPEKKGKKGKKARLVADIDPSAKAKVEAFAKVTGKSIAEAQEHLASVGVI